MRPIQVSLGPFAAVSTTAIRTSTAVAAAGQPVDVAIKGQGQRDGLPRAVAWPPRKCGQARAWGMAALQAWRKRVNRLAGQAARVRATGQRIAGYIGQARSHKAERHIAAGQIGRWRNGYGVSSATAHLGHRGDGAIGGAEVVVANGTGQRLAEGDGKADRVFGDGRCRGFGDGADHRCERVHHNHGPVQHLQGDHEFVVFRPPIALRISCNPTLRQIDVLVSVVGTPTHYITVRGRCVRLVAPTAGST